MAAAALWPLAEWARSIVFTGFPWLSLGYAALPGGRPTAFAGYAAIGGVFLVSLAIALVAAALALTIDAAAAAARRRAVAWAGAALVIVATGAALGRIEWTSTAGAPLAVSLIQGNVAQEIKFDSDFSEKTFDLYTGLVAASRGRLVVLPESAFPVFADEVPDAVLLRVISAVVPRNGDALIGMFTSEPALTPDGTPRYYNSVVTIGTARPQLYRKQHLVPFGETIPLEPVVGWLIRKVLAIPLASQARGDPDPAPLDLAGQRVAVDICYEDAFGAEIRRRRFSSTSPTMRGTGARSPRCSTTRSRRCVRSRRGVLCSARPTPASRRRSVTTDGRLRACHGSRAEFSRSRSLDGRGRPRTSASAMR